MVYRCSDKNRISYGAKGVTVCEDWIENINSFCEWAINNGWRKGLQLDKDIKGTGMLYSPEFCCFVTPKVNGNNKSDTRRYFYQNKYLSVPEISSISGINKKTLYSRVYKTGDIK